MDALVGPVTEYQKAHRAYLKASNSRAASWVCGAVSVTIFVAMFIFPDSWVWVLIYFAASMHFLVGALFAARAARLWEELAATYAKCGAN